MLKLLKRRFILRIGFCERNKKNISKLIFGYFTNWQIFNDICTLDLFDDSCIARKAKVLYLLVYEE